MFSLVGIIYNFDCNPGFWGDTPHASLLLELLVVAHFRTSTSVPVEKTIHPWIVFYYRKELYLFQRIFNPVRQCCWKLIIIF
jgi:hypothetical protein